MKKNVNKYPNVTSLPASAVPVDKYCKARDFSTAYLYKLIRTGKNKNFQIVVFHGINFIIPE